jgi:hypothetical protein
MIKFTTFSFLICISWLAPAIAQAGERATYVGEGRYSCSSNSIDCAVLRQRNNDISNRQRERLEAEQRYESYERREREYERERRENYGYDSYIE